VFDPGRSLKSWGGDGQGYDWPQREHGIYIDAKGFVWLGGNNCPGNNLEKLKPVTSQLPEIVRRIDQLTAVMVQPSPLPECVTFFPIDSGLITGALSFSIQTGEHTKSQSMESRVQSALATIPRAVPKSSLETMEHLALLKRWFYRSNRKGEIFLADSKGGLPLRRLVRGIARVYRGEKPEEQPKMEVIRE